MCKSSGLAVGLIALALGLPPAAQAADRALLIGVGEYRDPRINDLPGIDRDIDLMQKVSRLFGFEDAEIMRLEDDQATLAGIREAMTGWLRAGVGAEDRVLIYFSGHGTLVPDRSRDEASGFDSALIAHDTNASDTNPDNVLLDDQINELLLGNPSRHMLVFIDACHSGTVTRSLNDPPAASGRTEVVAKYFPLVETDKSGLTRALGSADSFMKAASDNYVALAAARDDEQSLASSSGSFFTLGLVETIGSAAQDDRTLTPAQLRDEVAGFIRRIEPERAFSPQLGGNEALFDKALPIGRAADPPEPGFVNATGPSADLLGDTPSIDVRLAKGGATLSRGDRLMLEFETSKGGWLSVVAMDDDGENVVLFPNSFLREEKRIEAGRYRFPGSDWPADVVLQALDPGRSRVVVLVTQEPLGLYESADGRRDALGQLRQRFGLLSRSGSKAMERHPLESGWVELNVCESAGGCK